MRLVRVSRELRFVWRLALFSTLLWGAFVLSVERSASEGSALWARVDSDASPGFIILLITAGLAFAAQVALRLAGKTGQAVGLIVPPIGDPAPITATDGAENVEGLLPALRANTYVGFGVLTALLIVTAILVAAIADVWPAWQGNHGRGGPVVTIGVDATVTRQAAEISGRGAVGVRNTLHTRAGDANAVGATPHAGERWTIVSDPFGGANGAYLVGGHAYLLALLIGLAFLLLELANHLVRRLSRPVRAPPSQHRGPRAAHGHLPHARVRRALDDQRGHTRHRLQGPANSAADGRRRRRAPIGGMRVRTHLRVWVPDLERWVARAHPKTQPAP